MSEENSQQKIPGKSKFARESQVQMTEMVVPNDTNNMNKLMGGRLMHLSVIQS